MCGERKGEEEREERMKGSGGKERKEKKRRGEEEKGERPHGHFLSHLGCVGQNLLGQ